MSIVGNFLDRIFAAMAAPSTVPTHDRDCCRCRTLATEAEDAGFDPPSVREAEVWLGPNGRTYHAGTCRQCTDIEWSENWDAKYERAVTAQDNGERDRLQRVMLGRRDKGRRYWSAIERKAAGLTTEEFKRAEAKRRTA